MRGRVTLDPHNRWGGATGKNYAEGMLDVSYISGMASGVRTVVANTNASSATESGEAFGAALLAFLVDLNSRPDPPHIAGAAAAAAATKPNGTAELPLVLSLSLGSLSYSSCDKLCRCAAALLSSTYLLATSTFSPSTSSRPLTPVLLTRSPCSTQKAASYGACWSYLQSQFQVCMFESADVERRIDVELQKLGLRGVTVTAAAGDGGSHFAFGPFSQVRPPARSPRLVLLLTHSLTH